MINLSFSAKLFRLLSDHAKRAGRVKNDTNAIIFVNKNVDHVVSKKVLVSNF